MRIELTVSIMEELRNTKLELARCNDALVEHEQRTDNLNFRLRHSDSLIDERDTELFRLRSE